jgi:hypothetical protein
MRAGRGSVRVVLVSLVLAAAVVVPFAGATEARSRPSLSVIPRDSLVDASVAVRLTGVRSRKPVTLQASAPSADGRRWVSRAVLRPDAAGVVDPARAASRGGTYHGREPMGLFWSMRPPAASPAGEGFVANPVMTIRFTAIRGGRVIARAQVLRRTRLPDVRTRNTSLAAEGFVGRLYDPPSVTSKPAILLLGGSEGGLPAGLRPGLLASHGYPTLALDVTLLEYEGAGHAAGAVPNLPVSRLIRTRYSLLDFGGTRRGNAAARAHSWRRLLQFLEELARRPAQVSASAEN